MHLSRYSSEYYARRGGKKKKRKTNPSNDKISVRIREKKKKREKGKGEEKRNYAEERYTDNIYRQRRLLK